MKKYNELELKRSIMIRVYTVYFLRKMMQPFFIKTFAFVLLSAVFLYKVDVLSVISNFVTAVRASGSALAFFGTAFSQSVLALKVVLLAEVVIGVMLAKDALERVSLTKLSLR